MLTFTIRKLRGYQDRWIVYDENNEKLAMFYDKKFVEYIEEVVPKLQKACLDALNVMVLGQEVNESAGKFAKTFESVAMSLKKVLGLVEVIHANEDTETTHPQ